MDCTSYLSIHLLILFYFDGYWLEQRYVPAIRGHIALWQKGQTLVKDYDQMCSMSKVIEYCRMIWQ